MAMKKPGDPATGTPMTQELRTTMKMNQCNMPTSRTGTTQRTAHDIADELEVLPWPLLVEAAAMLRHQQDLIRVLSDCRFSYQPVPINEIDWTNRN